MLTLKRGDAIALLGCSNGRPFTPKVKQEIERLKSVLATYKLDIIEYSTIYEDSQTDNTYEAVVRAKYLYEALQNTRIKAIFDLTGGDLSNETLVALTELMSINMPLSTLKYYVGYSDNSVLLNAFMANPSVIPVNFLLTQIVRDTSGVALQGFERTFIAGEDLFSMRVGNTFGGNLRCSLKLAGTPFWASDSIDTLLIEGLGGDITKIRTYLAQLELIGTFHSVKVLIVGEFTEIEQKNQEVQLEQIVKKYQKKYGFAVYHTNKIGHKSAVYPFKYKL